MKKTLKGNFSGIKDAQGNIPFVKTPNSLIRGILSGFEIDSIRRMEIRVNISAVNRDKTLKNVPLSACTFLINPEMPDYICIKVGYTASEPKTFFIKKNEDDSANVDFFLQMERYYETSNLRKCSLKTLERIIHSSKSVEARVATFVVKGRVRNPERGHLDSNISSFNGWYIKDRIAFQHVSDYGEVLYFVE